MLIMNNLPKKYKIKCRDAELGATTLSGYPKSLIKKVVSQHKWKTSVKSFQSMFNEQLELINDLKPMSISNLILWEIFSKSSEQIRLYLMDHPIYKIFTPLPKTSQNIENIVIVWKNPKYHMRALLLQLHYYNYYFPKNIYSTYQREIRKLKKELIVSKDLKNFYFHYITGTLLGYRPSSIKGYCINIQLNSYIYKKYDTREKYDELVSSPHYLSELKKARALYIETSHYRIFTREYPKFTKICNVWIEYMLNDSNMFKKYYDKYKKKITQLSV